jgi:hypothetical protein
VRKRTLYMQSELGQMTDQQFGVVFNQSSERRLLEAVVLNILYNIRQTQLWARQFPQPLSILMD